MDESQLCPCGSGQDYVNCCGCYLDDGEAASTAEQLMRSRYCAYVQRNSAYLLRSWHESTRPADLDLQADKAIKWLGLDIVKTEAGGAADVSGIVEFVARYKLNGKAVRLHECSRFRREAGQWLYVDGVIE